MLTATSRHHSHAMLADGYLEGGLRNRQKWSTNHTAMRSTFRVQRRGLSGERTRVRCNPWLGLFVCCEFVNQSYFVLHDLIHYVSDISPGPSCQALNLILQLRTQVYRKPQGCALAVESTALRRREVVLWFHCS